MPDPTDEPLTLDQLPPKVRAEFERIIGMFPSGFALGNVRRRGKDYAASIIDPDGNYGGDIGALGE
jgi:hypothetical protein